MTPEVEVQHELGHHEQDIGGHVVEEKHEQEQQEDVVDILSPKSGVTTWTVGRGEIARTYTQRPLSFLGKMQWFSLVGEVLDKALSGPQGMSLNSLFQAPTGRGTLSAADFRDADTFVQAVGKLLSYAPDFLVKSYCIWLNVPDYERDLAKDLMELPEEEGGLSDQAGMEIIEVFIDQNYEALDRFFREHIANLRKRVAARQKEASESRLSRR